jgi:hypothetical protein
MCVLGGAWGVVNQLLVFLVQIVDDLNPHFFLFGVLRGVTIAYRNCTLLSQCGGKGRADGPEWMDQQFRKEFPLATRVYPKVQDVTGSFKYDALSKIPIPGAPATANIQLLNITRIACYDLPGPYARNVSPEIWNPGSSSIKIRNDVPDACQRQETLGADYRGLINRTVNGAECEKWNAPSPSVCFSPCTANDQCSVL